MAKLVRLPQIRSFDIYYTSASQTFLKSRAQEIVKCST
jgi:hypothetical protein